jgi:hypothetical protein
MHQTPRHHPLRPSICIVVTNIIHVCNLLLVFASTTLQKEIHGSSVILESFSLNKMNSFHVQCHLQKNVAMQSP